MNKNLKLPTKISKEHPDSTVKDEPVGDIEDLESNDNMESDDKYESMLSTCSAEDLHHIIELANSKLKEMNNDNDKAHENNVEE